MTGQAQRLLGNWDLLDFTRHVEDELIGRPLGDAPVGQLVYSEQGRVTAVLMARDRTWPGGIEFPAVSDEERGRAALAFVGYAGTFSLDGDVVSHTVAASLYVEMVGTTLVRQVAWVGEDLLLATVPTRTRSGRARQDRLLWRRTGDLLPHAQAVPSGCA